jgi:nucleoside-diphosphate-sugar epimerase
MTKNLLSNDLDYIFESLLPYWESLNNKNIFITGGTGFFGCWFLESLIWVILKLNLNLSITILTRNAEKFKKNYPYLAGHSFINFHSGDVKNFLFPSGNYSHIIHAAAEISQPASFKGLDILTTSIQGTARVLEFARQCGVENFLMVSSGAVYGPQPEEMIHVPEEFAGRPKPEEIKSAYGIGKYAAEHLCHIYHQTHAINIKIARCFTFLGPYLSLNLPLAISHFLRDAIKGGPIIIQGDPSVRRSYLYAADLMVWLWKILFCGEPLRPFNVGSNEITSISQLASVIANCYSPPLEVIVKKNSLCAGVSASHYIPDISRAQNELQLSQKITLIDAINSTVEWHQSIKAH